ALPPMPQKWSWKVMSSNLKRPRRARRMRRRMGRSSVRAGAGGRPRVAEANGFLREFGLARRWRASGWSVRRRAASGGAQLVLVAGEQAPVGVGERPVDGTLVVLGDVLQLAGADGQGAVQDAVGDDQRPAGGGVLELAAADLGPERRVAEQVREVDRLQLAVGAVAADDRLGQGVAAGDEELVFVGAGDDQAGARDRARLGVDVAADQRDGLGQP